MAYTPNKVQYFKRGETGWELFYFETSADQIAATDTLQVSTKAQLNLINTYLNDFNTAEHLVQLDSGGEIPVELLPSLIDTYLTKSSPTFTGTLSGGEARLTTIKASDNTFASITLGGQDESIILNGNGALEVNTDAGMLVSNGWINMLNNRIINLATPEQPNDAANREYVDNKVSSGFTTREPVKAASISNITITSALNALDGVSLNANDRVLIKNQTTASQNGVYVLNASKIPQRLETDSALGSAVFVESGNTNNDYIYHCSTENTWVAFSKPDTVKAGLGLAKSGTTLRVGNDAITNEMLEGNIDQSKIKAFTLNENVASWDDLPFSSSVLSINSWFNALAKAIKLLRGTTNYYTSNPQTIAGAYNAAQTAHDLADDAMAAIPTIGVGMALPTSGMKAGDLFFLKK